MSGEVTVGLVVLALSVLAFPFAWRRSQRRWTTYAVGTGAPVVVVQLAATGLLTAVVGLGAPDSARTVLMIGLVAAAATQYLLVRSQPERDEQERLDRERRERDQRAANRPDADRTADDRTDADRRDPSHDAG